MSVVSRSEAGLKSARKCYAALRDFYAHCRHLHFLYNELSENSKQAKYFKACCFPIARFEKVNDTTSKLGVHYTYPEAVDGALVFLTAGLGYQGISRKGEVRDLNDKTLLNRFKSIDCEDIQHHLRKAGQACVDFVGEYTRFKDSGFCITNFMGIDGDMKKDAEAAYYRHKVKKFNSALTFITKCLDEYQSGPPKGYDYAPGA